MVLPSEGGGSGSASEGGEGGAGRGLVNPVPAIPIRRAPLPPGQDIRPEAGQLPRDIHEAERGGGSGSGIYSSTSTVDNRDKCRRCVLTFKD